MRSLSLTKRERGNSKNATLGTQGRARSTHVLPAISPLSSCSTRLSWSPLSLSSALASPTSASTVTSPRSPLSCSSTPKWTGNALPLIGNKAFTPGRPLSPLLKPLSQNFVNSQNTPRDSTQPSLSGLLQLRRREIDIEDKIVSLGDSNSQEELEEISVGRLFDLIGGHASAILKFLKVRDIISFHFASQHCYAGCRNPKTHKLLNPTFIYQRVFYSNIDAATVESVDADNTCFYSSSQIEHFAAWLASCTSLREFRCCCSKSYVSVEDWARLTSSMPNLMALELSQAGLAINKRRAFKQIQSLDHLFISFSIHLRQIDLSYNDLQDEHVVKLVEVIQLRKGGQKLEDLYLRSNYLRNESGYALGDFLSSDAGGNMKCLDLRNNRMDQQGACSILSSVRDHPCMREIRVGYNQANKTRDMETCQCACFLLLRALNTTQSHSLELLDLASVRMGDEGMIYMSRALADNTKLLQLLVAYNSIGVEGAKALSGALEKNQYLQHVDIRDNELQDEGAEALAVGLSKNQSLRKIQVARNDIASRGALALMAAYRCSRNLQIDFGATGRSYQGLVTKNPTLTDYRFMRNLENQISKEDDGQRRSPIR